MFSLESQEDLDELNEKVDTMVATKLNAMVVEIDGLKRQVEELKEDINQFMDEKQEEMIENISEFLTENHGYKFYINEVIKQHIMHSKSYTKDVDIRHKFKYRVHWYDKERQIGVFKSVKDRNLARKMVRIRMEKLEQFTDRDDKDMVIKYRFDIEHEWNVLKTEVVNSFELSTAKLDIAYGSIVFDK